jgi:isoquinoline 1-oxidoreductase beta subunit
MSATRRDIRRRAARAARDGAAVTRRDFLRTGALASAGLVVAFHVPAAVRERAEAAAATFEPNAWLRVGADGLVTVMIARSEMGQGPRTALPMLVAEELEADWTKVRFEQAEPSDRYGNMSTGGSQSIRSLHEPLRRAGAQAREMLVAAAAATWKVDRATCRAENGTVVHAPSGRRLGYGALAASAARLPVPQEVALKDWKDHRVVGTSPRRLDGPEKNDGRARFGIDVRAPGMLTAVVARCPVFGGKARSFDSGATLDVKGVKRVIAIESGVAVVADSYWAARKGLDALKVQWDEGALATLDDAAIARAYAQLARKPGATFRKQGDGAAALAGAARTLEAVYETPYLAHATMEPMNCTAHVSGDACTVWVGSQNATGVQATAAEVAGLPKEKVRVRLQYLGGGFGRRSERDFVAEAVELSKKAGAMVKVVWSREDDIRHDWYRPATHHLLRAGLDAAGAPLVWGHRMVGPGIIQRFAPRAIRNGVDPTSIDWAENQPYAFPHQEHEVVLHDPGIPVGWWRSVSASQNAFAIECFLDEVAAAAGVDPVEFRRRLLAEHERHRRVLDAAAERAGWGTPLPARRGRGIALCECFDSIVAQVAEVSVSDAGAVRVHRMTCAVDCGHAVHPDNVKAQMESGIVYGLSAALMGEISIQKGRVVQGNFDDYPVLTLDQCPEIDVLVAPTGDVVGGIGEPGLPPTAPAVVNAVAAATGVRVRRLPLSRAAEALRRG